MYTILSDIYRRLNLDAHPGKKITPNAPKNSDKPGNENSCVINRMHLSRAAHPSIPCTVRMPIILMPGISAYFLDFPKKMNYNVL